MVEKDKDAKTEIRNNAKVVKQNDVKEKKIKETFDDHFKGTAVDPDLDLNLDLNVAQQLPDVEESQQDEDRKSADISELKDVFIATDTIFDAEKNEEQAKVILEKELQINSNKNRIGYFFLTLTLFLIGFLVGQYYETSSRNTV